MRFESSARRFEDRDIWDIDDIAAFFHVSRKSAERMAARPGFPTPVGNRLRYRRWQAEQVRAYVPQPATEVRLSGAAVVHQIAFKASR